jgi:DnaJ-domain-containing protein 1
MPGPIRVRIAEIIYQNGYDVKRNLSAAPYRITDSVSISKEAVEKFKAYGPQELHAPQESAQTRPGPGSRGGRDGRKKTSQDQDPELKRNLEALNLDLGAKPEEIRKAYLEAVKKYHPDRFLNRPPELVRSAEEKTKQVNAAYSILKKA